MAGYRDNQWYLPPEENLEGISGIGGLAPTPRDNEPFLYPGVSKFQTKLGIGSQSNTNFSRQTKGFIRSLNRIAGVTNADRRFFFQFNPPALMRNLVMNTDMLNPLLLSPGELTLPVPGQANFSFEIMIDRQAEVNAGVTDAQRARGLDDLVSDEASAYEIGVLADINVLDKVIGVGVDPEAVETALKRAKIQYSYQPSDSEDGGNKTSNISANSTPIAGADGKYTVQFTHSTKDFVVNGNTVSITGCTPTTFNIASATVSEVSNVTPYTFKISYDANPGASCTSYGVATNLVTAGSASTDSNLWNDTQVAERLTTLGNESNRAFLIPNPVRVVFSSLYMVDGYVTAVNLLFTKFSRNMVPVTATLSIQMEARYIGFAREKTFLTQILEQAKEASTAEPTTPPPTTIVNNKYNALLSVVNSVVNDYEILIAGTDNDDNPVDWCKPGNGSYKIKDILSFNTLVVQFGFRTAYTFKDTGWDANEALKTTDPRYALARYLAQGNIKSITHQVTKVRIFRDVLDPSEEGVGIADLTLLEIGPIVAPQISSYTDFLKYGALGGSGATELSQVTNVTNTKLAGLSPGYSSGEAKDIARNLYFVNAIPGGKSINDIILFAEVEVTSTITDNDGNSITIDGKVSKHQLGNRDSYFHVRPAIRPSSNGLPQTVIVG